MTAATPPARYSAIEGARAGGIATAELHSAGSGCLNSFPRMISGRSAGFRSFDCAGCWV
jgi:hypothetical protein